MDIEKRGQLLQEQKQHFDQWMENNRWLVDEQQESADGSFDKWKQSEELKIKFLEALAEIRLKLAKANLIDMEVEKEEDKDRMRDKIIKQVEIDIDRMNADSYVLRRKKDLINEKSAHLRALVNGHRLSKTGKSRFWQAYSYFSTQAGFKYSQSLYEQKDWGTEIELIEKYRTAHDLPQVATQEHLHLMQAINKLESTPNEMIQVIVNGIKDLRDGTYSVWDLPSILTEMSQARDIML